MSRYDVFRKKKWTESKFRKASIRNNVSVLTHDTINLCNTLYDIAEGLNKLAFTLNNPEIRTLTSNTAENTQTIARTVSKVGSNSITDIGITTNMIAKNDEELAGNLRVASNRMEASARELERI